MELNEELYGASNIIECVETNTCISPFPWKNMVLEPFNVSKLEKDILDSFTTNCSGPMHCVRALPVLKVMPAP
jgi:hypothetical protein